VNDGVAAEPGREQNLQCQSAFDWDPLSASKRGSDSLLMQFGGCVAL
jgi:hypothetical protein